MTFIGTIKMKKWDTILCQKRYSQIEMNIPLLNSFYIFTEKKVFSINISSNDFVWLKKIYELNFNILKKYTTLI